MGQVLRLVSLTAEGLAHVFVSAEHGSVGFCTPSQKGVPPKGTNTNALNELPFCRVIQNPPIPPLVKGGEGGFVQEFNMAQCQISYCVRIGILN